MKLDVRSPRLRAALALGCIVPLLIGARPGVDVADLNLGLVNDTLQRVAGPVLVVLVNEEQQGADLNRDGDTFDLLPHVFDARTGTTTLLNVSAILNPIAVGRLVILSVFEDQDLNGDGDRDDSIVHVYDTERRILRNLRLPGDNLEGLLSDGQRFAFGVNEAQQGADLNGDGDTADVVLHVFDVLTGRTVNTRLGSTFVGREDVRLAGRFIATIVGEDAQGQRDLNGDGDSVDGVVHIVDAVSGRSRNLGITADDGTAPPLFEAGAGVLLVGTAESEQGADLNRDGDRDDIVAQLVDLESGRRRNLALDIRADALPRFDPAQRLAAFGVSEAGQGQTDLNGDGDTDDSVLHLLDTASGEARNTRVAGRVLQILEQRRIGLSTDEASVQRDLNGDGDVLDAVVRLLDGPSLRLVNTRTAIETSSSSPFGFPITTGEGSLLSFRSPEAEQGRDLNGDGDLDDVVLQVSDLARGVTRSSGVESFLTPNTLLANGLVQSDGRYAIPVLETGQGGRDLNGDGDAEDVVLHLFDARTGRTRNLGLAVPIIFAFLPIPAIVRGDGFVALPVFETATDWNGDGDLADPILHLVDLPTGTVSRVPAALADPISFPLFAGIPESVLQTQNPFFALLTRPSPAQGIGDVFSFGVSEGAQGETDLNGDGDSFDIVIHAARISDVDRDGRLDFADDRISGPGR